MNHEPSLKTIQSYWHGSYKSYWIGFIGSLILTCISFSLALLKSPYLPYALSFLALIQAVFQLRFFLHLGQEEKPQWETLIFYFMLLILLIIVLGSLWIMYDLNARMGMNHG